MATLARWFRRLLVISVLGIVAFFVLAPTYLDKQRNPVIEHAPYAVSDAARTLHDSLVIGDLHADPLLWKRDLTKRNTRGQMDIPRLIEGNVTLQVFTAVTKSPAGQNIHQNEADARSGSFGQSPHGPPFMNAHYIKQRSCIDFRNGLTGDCGSSAPKQIWMPCWT